MKKIHKRIFVRNDSRELYLYGYNEHTEKASREHSKKGGTFSGKSYKKDGGKVYTNKTRPANYK